MYKVSTSRVGYTALVEPAETGVTKPVDALNIINKCKSVKFLNETSSDLKNRLVTLVNELLNQYDTNRSIWMVITDLFKALFCIQTAKSKVHELGSEIIDKANRLEYHTLDDMRVELRKKSLKDYIASYKSISSHKKIELAPEFLKSLLESNYSLDTFISECEIGDYELHETVIRFAHQAESNLATIALLLNHISSQYIATTAASFFLNLKQSNNQYLSITIKALLKIEYQQIIDNNPLCQAHLT